ncbi:hypothetical protein Spico_1160 [Parasphaerochaeta coccoides DSM 17374]|uniref:Uncharacterized protein n=1 Tax=Parasphaerochaeta coccoides (strain ATCC BAA-1237 / DSM 17374 / SPN1) TaxID=760011 RepID=F4GL36_PARC1|nr:hypothetical protein Spico_1160 [Parasphaerochaeta coccoides DSM 17374]
MITNTKLIVTMTEANQPFSKATKLADKNSSSVIFKNNRSKYLLLVIVVSFNFFGGAVNERKTYQS